MGIDLVRLRAVAGGLISAGFEAEIVAPVEEEGVIEEKIPVRGLGSLDAREYDWVKTSYHDSIELIDAYKGPVVSRIVRVVDEKLPERDEPFREKLLRRQALISERAEVIALNNKENADRWRQIYGERQKIILVPTGCPSEIPPARINPLQSHEPAVLFLGSLAAERMARLLNATAQGLAGIARVHLVGRNKTLMYGANSACILDSSIVNHGELPESEVWDFIRNAKVGLAFATGPHPFDNDVSKILNYLRGGLPVVSEDPILNNELIRETGHGRTFNFNDKEGLISGIIELLENPYDAAKEAVMLHMIKEHSWRRRVQTYIDLFSRNMNRPAIS
jgi:glycosyltransferase involved in cell wall biosynthesis